MADPLSAPSEDPFAQTLKDVGPEPEPAPAEASVGVSPAQSPAKQDNDPFDFLDEIGPSPVSATGAFARGAEKAALPAVGSLPLIGAGAEAGASAGAPLAPFTYGLSVPVGAAIGGIAAGIGGSYLLSLAQNWGVKKLSDSWKDKLGLDDRTARMDEEQHPIASFMGGNIPLLLTMNPTAAAVKGLPANATALQQIIAHPMATRMGFGAVMGGMEAGNEKLHGGDIEWPKVAIATTFGVIMNRPNRVGESLTEVGAQPARAVLGRPQPTATVAQAADAKVMGPGVTEGVFRGTEEQAPAAAQTAQENARIEKDALGDHPEPDMHGIARQMEPDLFAQYDELLKRRETFEAWHGEGPGHEMAEKHLAATNAEITEMAPTVAAAYRRASDTVGTGSVEAEQFPSFAAMLAAHEHGTGGVSRETNLPEVSGETAASAVEREGGSVLPALQSTDPEGVREGLPGAGSEGIGGQPSAAASVPLPQRTIGDQRAAIAADVTRKLTAAGRPAEEAAAAGQLIAARYVTRAGRFEGKLGTAEELYAREGAAIAGPSGQPAASSLPTNRAELAAYLKDGGKVEAAPLAQAANAKIVLNPKGVPGRDFLGVEGTQPIITLLKTSNPSSFIHESGHQFLAELMRDGDHPDAPPGLRDDAQTVRDWLGVKDDIKTKHHEKFARGFEQYVREGVAPSPELASVFAKFRNWLLSIYQSIKGLGTEISPEIRSVFDRMLEMEPQRTVVAPERPSPTLLHDIHEAEAQHIEPHEAEGAMDRIVAETDRHIAELPPEIQREHETAAVQVEQARAAAAGESGPSAGEPSKVVGDSGEPGAESGGGAGGEEHRAVKPGGGGAGTESAGVQRPDPRSKLGDHAGTALAPGPADLFGARESPFTDRAGNIRLDTLNTAEDVKQALRDSATENNDFIGDRRGVVTDGQVLELANDIGMSGAEDLVKKHVTGQAYNAEQVVALRKLLRESAANVSTAAKKAATSGLDEDVLAYAQAKDRLQMVQKTVAGVTAEAGRALRAFRTLPGEADTTALEQMIKEATGKTLFQLKQEAKLASAIDTPQNVNKFMQEVDKHSAGGMLLEGWINGLLSAFSTQSTNVVGNAIFAIQHFGPEKAIAGLIGGAAHALGREGTYTRVGEVGAALRGAKEGAAPALAATGTAFRKGASVLLPGEEAPASGILEGIVHDSMVPRGTLDETATMRDVGAGIFGVVRGVRDAIMTGGALLRAGGVEGSPLWDTKYAIQGQIPDIQVRGMNVLPIGTAIRLPGRFLATMDTFFRSLNYSASKNTIAYRMASDEGLTGVAFDQRVAEIRNNPTPEVMAEARGVATETTFMDKGGEFVRAINYLTSRPANLPLLGEVAPLKFIAPFTNVVSRILEQTLVKRTPFGVFSKELRADLTGKNGNIAQDTASARMLLGSALMVGFGSLAAEGYITGSGPKDPKENAIWRLTYQPHSVRIGDMQYQVQKLGTLGMLMGMAADVHDMAHLVGDDKYTEAAAYLLHAIVQNVLDQSALQGPADLIKAIESPEQFGPQYVKSFLSSFVPMSSMVNSIARARDPYIRQTWSVLDAIKAKLPGYSETLHPRIDIWGEPVPTRNALGGTGVTGIYMQRVQADPVNKALLDLGIHPGSVEKKIRNIELTPQQYEDYSRIAGRMTKQRLDVIVNSSSFQTLPPYQRALILTNSFKESRAAASGMVKMKNPNIVNDATQALLKKINKK